MRKNTSIKEQNILTIMRRADGKSEARKISGMFRNSTYGRRMCLRVGDDTRLRKNVSQQT